MANKKCKNALKIKFLNQVIPEKTTKLYPDGDGLYLHVTTAGVKTFVSKYVCPETSSQSTVRIGVYPEVPLSAAREANKRIIMMLDNSVNPKNHTDMFLDGDISSIDVFKYKRYLHDLLYTCKYLR